jgi:recombinational DNA repair ATPase RecF
LFCDPADTHLQVDFKPNINFIVGENGSGKSAILTALTVCFGENAKKTNRASSLKEFIKHGQTYAVCMCAVQREGGSSVEHCAYCKRLLFCYAAVRTFI